MQTEPRGAPALPSSDSPKTDPAYLLRAVIEHADVVGHGPDLAQGSHGSVIYILAAVDERTFAALGAFESEDQDIGIEDQPQDGDPDEEDDDPAGGNVEDEGEDDGESLVGLVPTDPSEPAFGITPYRQVGRRRASAGGTQ